MALIDNDIGGLLGFPIQENPLVPIREPVIRFDPLRKCTWASESYRTEMDRWLGERFGYGQRMAYILDSSEDSGQQIFIHPANACLLKSYMR